MTGAAAPRVVAVGGLDPSGRAGLLADVSTITALGARAAAVATCLTAQGRAPISRPVPHRLVAAQLAAVSASGPVHAVKVGAIPDRATLNVVLRWLDRLRVPTVIDPVTVTSKGLQLSTLTPADFARAARKFVVLTPNRQEAEAGLQALRGFGAVVVKSVRPGTDAIFFAGKRAISLPGRPLARTSGHRGTGCRFASALAVGLARGEPTLQAARRAKRLVRKFLSTPILSQA